MQARKRLADGVDPSTWKRERVREAKLATANSFETVAREWHEIMRPKWTPHHAKNVIESLEQDMFPTIGYRPIAKLKAPEILDALRKIEKRGAIDIAQRVRQRCGAVFSYAIGTGFAETNPIIAMKGIFLRRRNEPRKMLWREQLPEFRQKLRGYSGDRMVQIVLRFIMSTMVRTNELRGARWQELNYQRGVWSIPAERMKMRSPHFGAIAVSSVDNPR